MQRPSSSPRRPQNGSAVTEATSNDALGPEVAGRARVDTRTKDLLRRLRPGEIAVIDHEDLDRVAAEGLVAAGVAAVVNASPSASGRYPNIGPLVITAAGIPLLDGCGPDTLAAVREGAQVAIVGDDDFAVPRTSLQHRKQGCFQLLIVAMWNNY